MRGFLCVALFGVFLHFSGAQRFRGSRRVLQNPDIGRVFPDFSLRARGSELVHRGSRVPIDTTPLESVNSVRARNVRHRSRAVIKSPSRNSHPKQVKGDNLARSRSFQTENSPNLPRQRTQLRNELSLISKEFNAFLRNSVADPSSSIPERTPSVSSGNNLRHEASRVSPITNSIQSGFPERNVGHILRNQEPSPGNEVVRELQRLNSLLMNNGPPLNSGNMQVSGQVLGIQNPVHPDIGNAHHNVHDPTNQLSVAPHSSQVASQHRGIHPQPKIVLLRNRHSATPLNVQIGNTRLEVLSGRSGSASQLFIQTVRDATGSLGVAQNSLLGNAPPVGFESPHHSVPSATSLHSLNQSQQPLALSHHSPLSPIEPSVVASARDLLKANNIQVSLLTTTAAPAPMVTTPLTPSGALRQILGPGVPETLFRKMAQDILPPELQRLDAIMRGQIANTINNNTNAGIMHTGTQTHALNLGKTKKIKITQNKTGPLAVVSSSIHTGGGPLKNGMVTEEPMEYDEILLRKVLQKMTG